MTELPLAGIRILDFSRLLPGPFVTQILADFGAEIIKVEDTKEGDGFRQSHPKANGIAVRHLALNRNKLSLSVDLKSPRGRDAVLRLARDVDCVIEQFRPGVMSRLGLSPDDIKAVNPNVIYCSLSGFGQDGSMRNLAAHDPQYLALAGILSLMGPQDGPPALSGLQVADIIGALMTAVGILIALRKKERTGDGDRLDMSLFDSSLGSAVTSAAICLATGENPVRGQERHTGRYPMAGVYMAKDGEYVVVSAIEKAFWTNLCRCLGHEEWIEHHFADAAKAAEIRAEMQRIFLTRTRDEWFEYLGDKDTCLAPVLQMSEALDSAVVGERGLIFTQQHPVAGAVRLLATPIKMDGVPVHAARPAPELGQHSRLILSQAGIGRGEIDELIRDGVVREASGDVDAEPQAYRASGNQ